MKMEVGRLVVRLLPEQTSLLLQEIHEGKCYKHLWGYSLAQKTIRQGFYWTYSQEYGKKRENCQKFTSITRSAHINLSPLLNLITTPSH